MRPVLLEIGGIRLYSYGLMLALAFGVATWLGSREAEERGVNRDWVFGLAVVLCISGVLGARVVYVLLDFSRFVENPLAFLSFSGGGLSFIGGMLAAILAGITYSEASGVSPWLMADVAAPYAALGYAIARVGCLLNGCCYGVPSGVSWAFACSALDLVPRHPTQVYSILGSLVIFGILMRLKRHTRFVGYRMFLYVGLYSIMRFAVEVFREVPRVLGWFSPAQIACIIIGLGAFGGIYFLSAKESRGGRVPHGSGEGRGLSGGER